MHTNNIFMHGKAKKKNRQATTAKTTQKHSRHRRGKKEMGAAQHDSREGIHFIPYPTVIIKV